jgi:hypothetical protein
MLSLRAFALIAPICLAITVSPPAQEPPPAAQTPPDQVIEQVVETDPSGLTGLTQVTVALGDTALVPPASTQGLQSRIETALANAGLQVKGGDVPTLELETHLAQSEEIIFGRMTLALRQSATLVRDARIQVTATTWSHTAVMLSSTDPDALQTLMESTTDQLVTQFLADHAQVNAPMPPQTIHWWSRFWPF